MQKKAAQKLNWNVIPDMQVQRFVHITYYFFKMELREVESGIPHYCSEF